MATPLAGMSNILRGEKNGSDISTFEVIYYDSWKHRDEPNASKSDALFIIYKDAENHKKIQKIENPPMTIFFVKPEERTFRTPREYLELEKCYPVKTTQKRVVNEIVKEIEKSDDPISQNMLKLYQMCSASSTMYQGKKEVLKWPYTLMSDMDTESYYRVMLGYNYNQMRGHTINKAFLDIESDIYGMTSTETAMNLDKTNACTIILHFDPNGLNKDMKTQVFTLLLRDHDRYPQQAAFEKNLDKFIKTCHEKFDKQSVIKDGKTKMIDCDADYHILFFDEEIELLQMIFKVMNTYRPDTCEVWNIAYDIPKLYARIGANGLDPVEVMCDPKWEPGYKFVDINVDNRPIDIAERKTSIRMASTTVYIDQMQTYAGIRKGRKAYGSNRLDNIAKIELGMGKWEFEPGIDVTNACIKDYWNFVLYNIRDVWCQDLIDVVTNDCMTVIYDMNQSFCPVKSLFKQITYQKQIYYTQRLKRGFVSGNNPNVNYMKGETEEYLEQLEDIKRAKEQRRALDGDLEMEVERDDPSDDIEDSEAVDYDNDEQRAADSVLSGIADIYKDSVDRDILLQGGAVGNPDLNMANGTELIPGIPSKHVFDNVLDMDFASEYPWAKFTRSLSKSTQFGRLIIPDRISLRQNSLPMGQQKRAVDQKYYTSGAEFTADYISGDVVSFGNVWFGLPTTEEMNKLFDEENGGD